ncbi:methyltransferase domain-containing protein [Luteolibacter pohnpeiensis]|uniref:Methyltransferase domain-containing protein n=1 Tax=Luteolibacter pohnpeiensis TaxID=454153 RepID=A0A934S4F2_9BACT|nr:class I SAM-dependent methyltransferase [Luteolibacter pohnpeiensis]MBK1881713.1 methyltransferase domain-containing protein [Luteolibacter pohnpeiensis]
MTTALPKKIGSLYRGRWDQHYVATKVRTDPLYARIHQELADSSLPLLDLGCGLGVLEFFLRELGVAVPMLGLDYDERKIEAARLAAKKVGTTDVDFSVHDARTGLPEHCGNVTILDILQFIAPEEQRTLLKLAAERVAQQGGKLVIRSGLRDSSLRFKITVFGDVVAKATSWMRSGPVHYPVAEDFQEILSPYGTVDISPLWGGTPFNNHLIVMSR